MQDLRQMRRQKRESHKEEKQRSSKTNEGKGAELETAYTTYEHGVGTSEESYDSVTHDWFLSVVLFQATLAKPFHLGLDFLCCSAQCGFLHACAGICFAALLACLRFASRTDRQHREKMFTTNGGQRQGHDQVAGWTGNWAVSVNLPNVLEHRDQTLLYRVSPCVHAGLASHSIFWAITALLAHGLGSWVERDWLWRMWWPEHALRREAG